MPYTSSIQSQRLYCFRHLDCQNRRQFGPYFSSLLAILRCNKRQGSCLLQACTTYEPYSGEFYCDVLHEGITTAWFCWLPHCVTEVIEILETTHSPKCKPTQTTSPQRQLYTLTPYAATPNTVTPWHCNPHSHKPSLRPHQPRPHIPWPHAPPPPTHTHTPTCRPGSRIGQWVPQSVCCYCHVTAEPDRTQPGSSG